MLSLISSRLPIAGVVAEYVSNNTGDLNEDTTASADRRPLAALETIILAGHRSRNALQGRG
jgi:hypothetical protein